MFPLLSIIFETENFKIIRAVICHHLEEEDLWSLQDVNKKFKIAIETVIQESEEYAIRCCHTNSINHLEDMIYQVLKIHFSRDILGCQIDRGNLELVKLASKFYKDRINLREESWMEGMEGYLERAAQQKNVEVFKFIRNQVKEKSLNLSIWPPPSDEILAYLSR